VLPTARSWVARSCRGRGLSTITGLPSLLRNEIIDAEFESVNSENDTKTDPTKSLTDKKTGKTLFDLSLDADSDFKNTRIPFLDSSSSSAEGTNYIDVKLAFMAELDGVQYGIGITFDAPAAVTVEDKISGTVEYLSSENDENDEYMQIMATQLMEHVGDDLRLHRTPRVLTISGPLDKYTKNWKEKLSPKPFEVEELLNTGDEE
jgi:hypothetical protein